MKKEGVKAAHIKKSTHSIREITREFKPQLYMDNMDNSVIDWVITSEHCRKNELVDFIIFHGEHSGDIYLIISFLFPMYSKICLETDIKENCRN